VVERYDRQVGDDGAVERIHQEDFCQALGIPPDAKYEEDGGPSLRRLAETLQAVAAPCSPDGLARAVTLNVLLGNGDAHGKNFSMLHLASGALTLAPLYDLVSTLAYEGDRLAMWVDDVQRIDRVPAPRLIDEIARWGMPRERAESIVYELLDAAPAAIAAAHEETPGVPDWLIQSVERQLGRLRKRE